MPLIRLVAISLLLLVIAACSGTPSSAANTVSQAATAQPALIATAQADQYWRDAQATTQSSQATLEANYQNIQGTAEAATSTAVAYQAQTTATTQAQQTADTLALALTRDTATTQAGETATMQAVNSIIATSTANALATESSFAATRQAIQLRQAEAQAQREHIFTLASYVFIVAAIGLVLALSGWLFWQLIPTLVNRAGVVRYGQHGNPLLLLNQAGHTIITDPMRMLQAALTIDRDGRATMPEITPNDIQTIVTGGVLHSLIEQAKYAPGHPPQLPAITIRERQLGPLSTKVTTRQQLPQPGKYEEGTAVPRVEASPAVPQLPASVSWNRLESYQGDGLAVGFGPQAVIALDLTKTPHILLAGSSGTGKTRRILRPLIAQALAKGVSVILMNESGADFSPFYNHPHAALIRGNAVTYATFLEAALVEMQRREMILRLAQVSEWSRLPAQMHPEPPILIAIDEVLSLALALTPREQKAFWGLLATYASRARKLAMSSVGALTDPTYRVLGHGLTWREQCTARMTFRVAKTAVSRAVLDSGGAENLEDGQFLAMLGTPQLVNGFAPNPGDAELIAYLERHTPQIKPRPEWLHTALQSLPC
ncbi:MAG: type IV secretion system DNA-binding domain-containing protein [Anaerolineae bacterium]|nr:type IV secretion system DNA-binding domain-containing protein [Anaerolineae bacterium]